MSEETEKPSEPEIKIVDEPGMAERFQRGLQRTINTPPRPRIQPLPKAKERPARKGRVHKGKTRT